MENLSRPQQVLAYAVGAFLLGFLCLYISSALFFEMIGLPEDQLKPWSIIEYWQAYHDNPGVSSKLAVASAAPFIVIILCLALLLMKNERLFGDARFAKEIEIKHKGLYGGKGIILGKRGGKFLFADGTEHVLVAAPSRSGKGVGIVIPNLLNWDGSAVVLDLKVENFRATSGFREKHGQQVFLWAPGDPSGKTHQYNPLSVIPDNPATRIDTIQKIGHFLCPTPEKSDPMWATEARSLFTAIALYIIDTGQPVTLGQCNRFIKTYSMDELSALIELHHDDLDPICLSNFTNYLGMGDRQRAGVKSTLTTALELFDNPIIDAATSGSDFLFSNLRKKKITVYVGVTPDNLARLRPLLNLFFQQCIDENTKTLPDSTMPHKVLLLMDEFTSLGHMEIIKQGIAFFAGYNLRLMPIIQGPAQLGDHYGEEGKRSMITNFMYRIVFAPNDQKDADEISAELGTKTVKQKSKNVNAFDAYSGSTTTSDTGRALMLPQEIKQLSRKKEIILIEAMAPIKADKVVYYEDPAFEKRFFNVFDPSKNTGPLPTEVPTQKIERTRFDKASAIHANEDSNGGIEEQNTTNALFTGLDNLASTVKDKPSTLLRPKTLDDNEIDDLVEEFWATAL